MPKTNNNHLRWVLVTGAGGFVGGHCVSALHAAGFSVLALQRSAKPIHNMPDSDTDSFRRIIADLNEDFDCPEPVQAIIHLAAQVVHPNVTATQFADRNTSTTISAFALARRLKVKVFVFHSSTSIYGNISQLAVDEETPSISPAPYGASKYLGELIAKEESAQLAIIAPRTPGIIGSGANPNFLADMVAKAAQNAPLSLRNPGALFNHVLHVDDYCQFIVALLHQEKHAFGFDAVNFASREPITIHEVARLIIDRFQSTSQINTEDTGGTVPIINVRKLENTYGFTPLTVSEAIIRYCDEWKSAAL